MLSRRTSTRRGEGRAGSGIGAIADICPGYWNEPASHVNGHPEEPSIISEGGQREVERRAAADLTFRPDTPAMRVDDAARDRQPEPGALVLRVLAAPVALEQLRELFGFDARTGVAHE